MRAELTGTGGPQGWPQPGCHCASCRRAGSSWASGGGGASGSSSRRPAEVLVDGVLRLSGGQPPRPAPGYQVRSIPGGWDISGPAGRMLWSSGPGSAPDPPPDAGRYDIALLDLIDDPGQLGRMRRRGLVDGETAVAAVHADHRVSSPAELARRCGFWGVTPACDGDVLTAPGGDTGGGGAAGHPGLVPVSRTLVLGGARSGKSTEAELRLAAEPEVSYVAAAGPGDGDPGWAERVAAHRARRPAWWRTVETTDVAAALRAAGGAVLLDGVGGWLAATMDACGSWESGPDGRLQRLTDDLVTAWRDCPARVVAVSEETGLGVVPATSAGVMFRDQLGTLNQRLAAEADETVIVIAGRVLTLPA
jgi:adenosylcobinamide kinase/adenosylcobinamide-phosphate guanylyltransferase